MLLCLLSYNNNNRTLNFFRSFKALTVFKRSLQKKQTRIRIKSLKQVHLDITTI